MDFRDGDNESPGARWKQGEMVHMMPVYLNISGCSSRSHRLSLSQPLASVAFSSAPTIWQATKRASSCFHGNRSLTLTLFFPSLSLLRSPRTIPPGCTVCFDARQNKLM